jgi:4-hydroxybenzoate polyprenyltransferase
MKMTTDAGGFEYAVAKGRDVFYLIHFFLPVALGWSLVMVVQRSNGAAISPAGLTLLLAGICSAYSFDRLADSSKERLPLWLTGILLLALTLSIGAICGLLLQHKLDGISIKTVFILAGVSLFYPKLKRFPLIKTLAVTLSWIVASTTIPLGGESHYWLSLDVTFPLIFLISAGCILCDLKDLQDDRNAFVPSLPVLLGVRSSCQIATVLAVVAAMISFLHHRMDITIGALLLVLAAQFPSFLSRKPIGAILVDSILTVPGVLIALGVV